METEAGIRVKQPQVKEYLEIPETERGKKGFFPPGIKVSMALTVA